MDYSQLLELAARGEDGSHQFKRNVTNHESFAADVTAFSNMGGGLMILGIADDGSTPGLSRDDVTRLNQLISNASSQGVRPPVVVRTENVIAPDGRIFITVFIPDGPAKPYMDTNGSIWVRCGADRRRATSRDEIARVYQTAGLVHADAVPVPGVAESDLDVDYFRQFLTDKFGDCSMLDHMDLATLLHNMNLASGDNLTISGTLLFSKTPGFHLPAFIIKATSFPGTSLAGTEYLDSRDITGRLADMFRTGLGFVMANLKHRQGDRSVNSVGEPEIPRIVIEELLANALIHRDYFVSAPIRLFVFRDRVEIISPGHLPNNLTVANIKAGNSNIRNPILASNATWLLPYRGIGSGIIRALAAYPDIELIDDRDGNKFSAVIRRPEDQK